MTTVDVPASRLQAAMARDGFAFPNDGLTPDECARALAAFQEYDDAARRRGGVWSAFRHFPKVHLAAAWADELIRHPRILDTVERLLGPDLLVWSTNVFTRPAHSGDVLAWHQDALHYGLRGFEAGAVRVWLGLTATTLANGTMRFARGTHQEGIVAHRTGADRATIRASGLEVDIEVDESEAVPVLLNAGQFSLHHMAVAHSSGPNSTDVGRVNFAVDYLAAAVAPVDGSDTAMLVRGTDTFGNFVLEERLPFGTPEAERQFQRSITMRMRRLGMA